LISDVLYLRENAPERIVNVDIQAQLEKLSASVSVERVLKMAEFLRVIESSLKSHVNRQMLTDMLAITGNTAASAHL
jgi:hypothetical protein